MKTAVPQLLCAWQWFCFASVRFPIVSCAYVGHVILGSVDGNRIWAKDLRITQITHLEVKLDSIRPIVVEQLFFSVLWACNLASQHVAHKDQVRTRETYRKNSIIIGSIFTIITSLKVGLHIIYYTRELISLPVSQKWQMRPELSMKVS